MPALTAQQLQAIAQASTSGLKPSPLGLAGLNAQAQAAFGGIPDQANVGGILPTAPQIAPQAPKPAAKPAAAAPTGGSGLTGVQAAQIMNMLNPQGGSRDDRGGPRVTPAQAWQQLQWQQPRIPPQLQSILNQNKPGGGVPAGGQAPAGLTRAPPMLFGAGDTAGGPAPKPPPPPPMDQHVTQFVQKYTTPQAPNPVLAKLGYPTQAQIATFDPSAQMPPATKKAYQSVIQAGGSRQEAMAAASAHDHASQVVDSIWGGQRW